MKNDSLVRKALNALRQVASSPDGIGLSELSRSTGIPKATCHRILTELCEQDMVILDPESKRYYMSIGAMAISMGLQSSRGMFQAVMRILHNLTAETQETSGLDLCRGPTVTVAFQVDGPRLIGQMPKPVPRTMSTAATSTGKVFAAWAAPSDVRQWLEEECSEDQIEATIGRASQIRTLGYAVSRDEVEIGASAIGAPVLSGGRAIAAVWVGGPTFRFAEDRLPGLVARILPAANMLSELLRLQPTALSVLHRPASTLESP